ncbi:MAG: proton-translocating NADH-quinone oxidoreductase, chain [Actinomycetia bacterium]|nr:proton-translocating NADH-quinone oxidoreductase, chain [Actinomycetes bacterium]
MIDYAWVIPLVPAISFVLILFFGKRMKYKGAEIGIAAVGASFVMACIVAGQWIAKFHHAPETGVKAVTHAGLWWQNGGQKITAGIQIDGLAAMMMFVVTLISLLVHIYSTAYMHDDRRYTYYFAALSLFTASMLLLVVADNTLLMLCGWELVGLCSFMLIGHWWEEEPNSNAALKAFFTTRTGDVGLLIGVVLTWFMVKAATGRGSFNIVAVNKAALGGKVSHTLVLVCASGLLIAIIGKSGQFPLHTWLPDAMAGPTPVSALIHAATMVVAGVYLGARLYGIFWSGFSIGHGGVNVMAAIGGITIIIGAVLAFVQRDIKKVLAYSTISQLGYMVMALGVGAWTAAIFHLFTHAFFKALLFLGAGSVSHSGSHHSFDMKEDMGGLRKYMPQTFTTFVIGAIALAGIFPLAGFWSKDEILVTANQGSYDVFLYVGLVGAFLTAAYMTRCVYLTFFGEYRGHGHPHESPPAITVPLWILAFFAVVAGILNAPHVDLFKKWINPSSVVGRTVDPELIHHIFARFTEPTFDTTAATISVLIALVGIAIGALYYFGDKGPHGLTQRSGAAKVGYTFLENKYYLDHLYTDVIVGGVKGPIANASYWVNQHVIDGVVNGAGKGTSLLANFTYDVLDRKVVDGAINETANATGWVGGRFRGLQSGKVQQYALVLFGAVGLASFVLALVYVVS